MSFWSSLTGAFDSSAGRNAANRGYNAQKGGIDAAKGDLTAGADQGYGFIDAGLKGATKTMKPWRTAGHDALDLYGTLSGLNGGQAGVDAFNNSVDKMVSNEGLNSGMDAIGRMRAGSGSLFSGNALIDAMTFGNNFNTGLLANARGALNPLMDKGYSADTQVGDWRNQAGTNKANIATGTAGAMAGLDTGLGQAGYQREADMYAADQTASSNAWNAVLGVGQMIPGFGKMFGFGGGGGGFGGGGATSRY